MNGAFYYPVDQNTYLEQLELKHAEEVSRLVLSNKDYFMQWFLWAEKTLSLQDTIDFILATKKDFFEKDVLQCAIIYKNRLVGVIGFHHWNPINRSTWIGYWLAPEANGFGIMTKSCRALIDYAFFEKNMNRIEVRAATHNLKSRSIPERLGFEFEGVIRQAEVLPGQRIVDHAVYGMLKKDWS